MKLPGIKLFGNLIVFVLSLVVLVGAAMAYVLLSVPDVRKLEKCMTTSMFKVNLCPDSPNYVRLSNISPYVLHAVIAAEDAAFYSHEGFDWHELKASVQTNLLSGGFRRGGSTLTQQLAKNVFLTPDKSIWRKVKEAYLAHAIEKRYKKDFILEKYLNVVEFGPGLFGVKAAAHHYFNKGPGALHPLEAAYLAFLLPNPKEYSKTFKRGSMTKFSHKMVATILKRMAAFGKLSEPAYKTAIASIDEFPWAGLTMDSFSGQPTHSLEATLLPGNEIEELPADDGSVEQIMTDEGKVREPEPEPAPESEGPAEPFEIPDGEDSDSTN